MEKSTWKILGIILIIVLVIENLFFMWGWFLIKQQNDRTMECLYDFCADYVDAEYNTDYGVCYCYELDTLGNYMVGDSKYLG